jgi:hypothetical protein
MLSNNYIKILYEGKKSPLKFIIKGILNRVIIFFMYKKYDLILLEKQLFPYIPFLYVLFFVKND